MGILSPRLKKQLWNAMAYAALIVTVAVFLFPLAWMVLTSLKTDAEIYAFDFTWLPIRPTLEHYNSVVKTYNFLHHFGNSLVVAVTSTVLATTSATLGAYAIARLRFVGRDIIDRMVLFIYLIPVILLVLPFFIVLSSLGLHNTRLGLILATTTYALPFSLWVLKGFLQKIPVEIEQAALIDGASRLSAFVRVVLPLAIPGIITATLFSFILAWNDYLFALVIVSSDPLKTLPLVISGVAQDYSASDGALMAMGVMATLPVVLLYVFLQRYFISGLSAGAVKG